MLEGRTILHGGINWVSKGSASPTCQRITLAGFTNSMPLFWHGTGTTILLKSPRGKIYLNIRLADAVSLGNTSVFGYYE